METISWLESSKRNQFSQKGYLWKVAEPKQFFQFFQIHCGASKSPKNFFPEKKQDYQTADSYITSAKHQGEKRGPWPPLPQKHSPIPLFIVAI
jgi:hypothetical protein